MFDNYTEISIPKSILTPNLIREKNIRVSKKNINVKKKM